MNVLTNELWTIYQGLIHQTEAELEPLPIQYADFVLWQREHFNEVTLAPQLEYWQNQLAGIPPILELPLDRPRPAKQTFAGSSQSFQLSQELTEKLQAFSQQLGTTLYMTVLATFGVLMHRYSRQSDIVIGSPIANRNYHEVKSLIGFFVNTLALRLDLANQPSFTALLQQVRQVTLDAYAHQDAPFSKVVEQLELDRNLSHHPIFQVMFTWQNIPDYHEESRDLSVRQIRVESVVAKFDLDVSLVKSESGLRGSFTYNTDLFDAATIERMTAHFQTLLEGIIDNPQQPIAQLPLLTPTEQQQLLVEWNDTATEYPQDKCIYQLFEEQVERTPDAVALVFEGQQLTYRELNQRANQLAHYLQKLGVKSEVLVGICVDRSVEMMVGLLGILKAGGAYVPLDPAYPQERISFMLEDSQLSLILTQSHLHKVSEHLAQVIYLDSDREIAQESNANLDVDLTPDNVAYIIYTSGSTGKPKGVQIIHRAVVNFLTSMSQKPRLSSEDALLAVTTISFDIAVLELFLPIIVGAKIVLVSREVAADATKLIELLAESDATVMQATPATWRMLLAAGWQGKENLKILCGGEAMPRTLADELLSKSAAVWNMYGPTETTIWSAVERVEPGDAPVLIGRAIANTEFYLIDTNSFQNNGAIELVPVGVVGELLIGGVGLARGYLNRPELTDEKFLPNPFSDRSDARLYRTGDLARYLPNGKIELIGRIDNQVKIRGFRIELGEIEAVLTRHPGIGETVVIAREDIPGDKRLIAYVVSPREQANSSDLRSFLQERLPNYMVPSAFVFLDTLPLTPNGKVDRRALPAPDADNIQLDTDFVPPSTPTEERLATIWADFLGIERVGIHDNFFELGGHSLLALRLFAKIEKVFGRTFSLATLFEAPTVKDLAHVIDRKQSLAAGSCLVPIQPQGSKPPLFLLHARGTSVLVYRDLANYLGTERPVYGIQPQGLNGEAEILTTVQEMAAYYIQEIRKIQPVGPYLLGGYSFGGELAFEMSRQLLQQGEKVDKLILFDCNGPNSSKRLPFSQRTIIHFNNLLERKHNYLIEKAVAWQRWLQQDSQYNFQKLSAKVLQNFNLPLSLRLQSIFIEDRNEQASKNHHPQFYPGKVTLMRTVGTLGGVGLERDKYLGWKDLVGQIDIYPVPGHHLSMFEEPHVRQLAEAVKSCLNS